MTTSLPVKFCIVLSYLLDYSLSSHIDCSDLTCQNTFINCFPNEDCYILCTESQSCFRSVINCPIHGDCNIYCTNYQSCGYIVIDAALSSGKLNIICDSNTESTDHCKGMKIYGSKLNTHSNDLNLQCNGYSSSCIQSEINCAKNSKCIVTCDGSTSCKYSKVNGALHSDLSIHCNEDNSCYGTTFKGDTSSTLNITGCTAYDSCSQLILYCPPNTNDMKNCFIEGNDNLGKGHVPTLSQTVLDHDTSMQNNQKYKDESYDKSKRFIILNPTSSPTFPPTMQYVAGVIIFAKNGWKDIHIEYSGTYDDLHIGTMVCGDDYSVSCAISPTEWKCVGINEYCNDADGLHSINVSSLYSKSSSMDDMDHKGEITHVIVYQPLIRPTTLDETVFVDARWIYKGKLVVLVLVAITIVLCCMLIGWLQSRKEEFNGTEGDEKQGERDINNIYPFVEEYREHYDYSSDFDVMIA